MVATRKASSIDERRVAMFYEKLTGVQLARAYPDIRQLDHARTIIRVEIACQAVLAAITELENARGLRQAEAAEKALRKEFEVLNTLQLRSD